VTSIGLVWRAPGAFLDFLPFAFLFAFLGWLGALPGPFWRVPQDWYWTEWWLHVALESWWNYFPALVILIVLVLISHAVSCLGFGASRVLGIRILSEVGDLTAGKVGIRLCGVLLNILSLGLGYLWIFAHPQRLGWHDILSRTFPSRE